MQRALSKGVLLLLHAVVRTCMSMHYVESLLPAYAAPSLHMAAEFTGRRPVARGGGSWGGKGGGRSAGPAPASSRPGGKYVAATSGSAAAPVAACLPLGGALGRHSISNGTALAMRIGHAALTCASPL